MQENQLLKYSRPLILWVGTAIIAINYCIIPLICRFLGKSSAPLEMPSEFWLFFGATVGIYNVARTVDKHIASKKESGNGNNSEGTES